MDVESYRGYRFSAKSTLSDDAKDDIIQLIISKPKYEMSVLGGRSAIRIGKVSGFGDSAVKAYARGGAFSYINRDHYLRFGETRPEQEYLLLEKVKALGLHAPSPIAAVSKGGLFYQGWLAMKEIPEHTSLASLALEPESDLESAMESLVDQVGVLIRSGIYHVDLHPGNAVLDKAGTVYILDYDKAKNYSSSPNNLRDHYLCRWRRAVIKHSLPDSLVELMSLGLRKRFEGSGV